MLQDHDRLVVHQISEDLRVLKLVKLGGVNRALEPAKRLEDRQELLRRIADFYVGVRRDAQLGGLGRGP